MNREHLPSAFDKLSFDVIFKRLKDRLIVKQAIFSGLLAEVACERRRISGCRLSLPKITVTAGNTSAFAGYSGSKDIQMIIDLFTDTAAILILLI